MAYKLPSVALISFLLLATSTSLAQTKQKSHKQFFELELVGGMNGCFLDYCKDSSPDLGGDITLTQTINKYYGWALSFHYGSLKLDERDSSSYYSVNINGRLIYPMGPVRLFSTLGFGYQTLFIEGNTNEDYPWTDLRATGPKFDLALGIKVNIFKNLNLGLMVRMTVPIWSEGCYRNDNERICTEPQNKIIDLSFMPWFAGAIISYSFN